MKKHVASIFHIGLAVFGISQASFANTYPMLQSITQEAGQQLVAPIMLAAAIDTRVERRHDAVDNTADRVEDKQDFREERRDCVGDGPDCHSDNRQKNVKIPLTVQRTE
jgi:hypothetical protein